MTDVQRRDRSAVITALLRERFPVLRSLVVAFCWPYRGEFDPRHVVHDLRGHGSKTVLPVVVRRNAPLEFREWWPGVQTSSGVLGLPVPQGTAVLIPEALLIPSVGFDRQGYRLGYGAGYFDRTLGAMTTKPLRIGVAFELSRMTTIHPQGYDIPMDFIVTEAGVEMVVAGALVGFDRVVDHVEATDPGGACRE